MKQELETCLTGYGSPCDVAIFKSQRGLLAALLVALFVVALSVRLVNLDAPGHSGPGLQVGNLFPRAVFRACQRH
jgi:hypothetical protein